MGSRPIVQGMDSYPVKVTADNMSGIQFFSIFFQLFPLSCQIKLSPFLKIFHLIKIVETVDCRSYIIHNAFNKLFNLFPLFFNIFALQNSATLEKPYSPGFFFIKRDFPLLQHLYDFMLSLEPSYIQRSYSFCI